MGRRMAENTTLETNGETIGMPVSRAVFKASRPSAGIPQQHDVHEERKMGTLRKQAGEMRRQVADGRRSAARPTQPPDRLKDRENSIRFRAFCLLQLQPAPSHLSLPVFGRSIEIFAISSREYETGSSRKLKMNGLAKWLAERRCCRAILL